MRVIEFTMYKTERRNESEGIDFGQLREDGVAVSVARSHSRGVSFPIRDCRRALSTDAGTRKMVNYAWSGRSQGKP